MAGFEDADNVRLEGVEELGRVDGCVYDCLPRRARFRLDVGEEEPQRVSWLSGEDREQRSKLRCLVVWQICEDEDFGVVFMDSVIMSA